MRQTTTYQSAMFVKAMRQLFDTECVMEYRFHTTRRWRFDYAIPKYKIAIEVEGGVWTGGRHTSSSGFLNDMEKYNTATSMGWSVLRCTPKTLLSQSTIELIKQTIQTHDNN